MNNQSINQSKMNSDDYVELRKRATGLVFDSYENTNTYQKDNYLLVKGKSLTLITTTEFSNLEISADTMVFFIRSTRISILVFERRA